MTTTLLDRFLRYISIDTRSDESSAGARFPSAAEELVLARLLVKELQEMGIADASLDEYGYVMASIPATPGCEAVPALGFIAHMDTSPDAPGACAHPQIIRNYDGGDIPLEGVPGLKLRVADFPELAAYKGQTLITTDGTSLLGADDKAGIAEILCAAQYLMAHPETPHGKVCIAFTPDEEIGCGADRFDVARFGARFAYTVDGGRIGELEYENFNAALARIRIQGRNVHPGSAKGRMIHALEIAMELDRMLPQAERPQRTEGYEGFFHLNDLSGTVESAECRYLIRDHDRSAFQRRKEQLAEAVEALNRKYGPCIHLDLQDQYYNMREEIEPHYHIVEKALRAMEMAGVRAKVQPIRGGTDGAKLSFMGLPCPNLFAGGENFHGKMEYIPLESMEAAIAVILNLIGLFREDQR